MTDAEKKIYDDFESASRAVLDKAKADAAAIGVDLTSIIGQTEKVVVKAESWIVKVARAVWTWLTCFFQFLDDPKGKFSHKRLIALALGFVCIRQLIIKDTVGALIAGGIAVVLAVISAVTKT